jgi:hypothetical protein
VSTRCRPDSVQLTTTLTFDVPRPWSAAIDQDLGATTRSMWLRRVVLSALQRRGVTGMAQPTDRRGQYDRLRKMAPERAKKERQRRHKREYLRQWRARKPRRPKPVPPPPVFQFHDSGIVNASDLAGLGVPAGECDAAGRFVSTSRHRPDVVRAALRSAMAAESERVWADRWVLFAAGD